MLFISLASIISLRYAESMTYWWRIFLLCLIVAVIGVCFWGWGETNFFFTQEQGQRIRLDRNGNEITNNPDRASQIFSGYDSIPSGLVEMLIRLEDRHIDYHLGIDSVAWGRIVKNWYDGGAVQGGSTIAQQVIKLHDQAFRQRGRRQKLRENILAVILTLRGGKQAILTHYLNHTHFPGGIEGYRQACLSYFATECGQLSVGHRMRLYARAKYPGRREQSEYILALIHHIGHTDYTLDDIAQIDEQALFRYASPADRVYRELVGYNPPDPLSKGVIKTAFDPLVQDFLTATFRQFESHLLQQDAHDGCIVVMARDEIIAAQTLREQIAPGLTINTCLIPRQVGSAAKPFLYAGAMTHLGRTGGTILQDEETAYTGDSYEGEYIPRNSTLITHGDVTLADALGSSLNIPAVQALNALGVDRYRGILASLSDAVGAQTEWDEYPHDYGLSLALGTKAMTVTDFAKMRSLLTRCDSMESDRAVRSLCQRYNSSWKIVKDILSINYHRRFTFPVYNWLDIPGVYAKTGTSRKFVDGWVCGGDGYYTVCVRVGNASGMSMKSSGYSTAGVIWHAVMQRLRDGGMKIEKLRGG